MIRNFIVRGSYKGASGHDHHVREFVREFQRQGVTVKLIDMPDWAPFYRLPDAKRNRWFDSLTPAGKSSVVLHFCMPLQVKRAWRKVNLNLTMFEATRIPKHWVKHSLKHDLVIVPTTSSYQAMPLRNFLTEHSGGIRIMTRLRNCWRVSSRMPGRTSDARHANDS